MCLTKGRADRMAQDAKHFRSEAGKAVGRKVFRASLGVGW